MKTSIKYLIITCLFLFVIGGAVLAQNDGNTKNHLAVNQAQNNNENELTVALDRVDANIFGGVLSAINKEDQLSQDGPYTIFAPSNDAVRKLPENLLNRLADNPEEIERIANNHIIEGQEITQVEEGMTIQSMDGNEIRIERRDDGFQVNGQRILEGERFENGIIYVIDGTIIPRNLMD